MLFSFLSSRFSETISVKNLYSNQFNQNFNDRVHYRRNFSYFPHCPFPSKPLCVKKHILARKNTHLHPLVSFILDYHSRASRCLLRKTSDFSFSHYFPKTRVAPGTEENPEKDMLVTVWRVIYWSMYGLTWYDYPLFLISRKKGCITCIMGICRVW